MTERGQFEAWVKSKDSTAPLHRRDVEGSERMGQYCTHWIQDQWEAWQASRRAALEEGAEAALRASLDLSWSGPPLMDCREVASICANAIRALSGDTET